MTSLICLLVALAAGFGGSYFAGGKNRNQMSWFWLCLLFPILILLVWAMPPLPRLDAKPHQRVYFQEDWPRVDPEVTGGKEPDAKSPPTPQP